MFEKAIEGSGGIILVKQGAIILAAGKGTRMNSKLPKVLHKINGLPMTAHVIRALSKCHLDQTVMVVGHEGELVQEVYGDQVDYAVQREQLGTGHAIMSAMPVLESDIDVVMIVCGDTPLLTGSSLLKMLQSFYNSDASCMVLTAKLPNPTGYGRIIRGEEEQVVAIIEEKDASVTEKRINEINTGTYCFKVPDLKEALEHLNNENAAGEYYLTDTISYLCQRGKIVAGQLLSDYHEILGVNNRVQMAQAVEILRKRKCEELMLKGVTIVDPNRVYIEQDVEVDIDTIIEPNVQLKGNTKIGKECFIGADTELIDTTVGDFCEIKKSVLWEASVADHGKIGPFAYLRPGSALAENVKVGDFVEIKNSHIAEGSKVPHLSYIGDATVGEKVNIGCGTITCNYDGEKKHPTIIGDGAFIGSNSNLVAPVEVGENAFVAAGSTITKDVPANALAVARGRQYIKEDWVKKK